MPHEFDAATVTAILGHMNTDHEEDNLVIVRAFGAPAATAAVMTGLDGDGGDWDVREGTDTVRTLRVSWPHAPITERADVRREVVALYDAARTTLGLGPRDEH